MEAVAATPPEEKKILNWFEWEGQGQTLLPDDRELRMLSKKCRIWTLRFKTKVRDKLEGVFLQHDELEPVWNFLPQSDRPWLRRDKALAITCMRLVNGEAWCSLVRFWLRWEDTQHVKDRVSI